MCLILFAINKHPDYPLIIAANRDEFYARPSKTLDWWPENPQILAGQDLESGGSWFGLNRKGYFAAVTNYREAGTNRPECPSRGLLVRDYLLEKTPVERNWLKSYAKEFNGFNLLYGKWNQLNWLSNRSDQHLPLQSGLFGLCNSLLDTPWPKLVRGKMLLRQALKQQKMSSQDLLQILQDDQLAADDKLPDTGIGEGWEKILSPIFIRSEHYGTRSSTILLIDKKQHVEITERNWSPTADFEEKTFQFTIEDQFQ